MKERIIKTPILISVLSSFLVYVLYIIANSLIPSNISISLQIFIDSVFRIIFSIICIVLLCYILRFDSLSFSFTKNGFSKGMFACLPFFLLIFMKILKFFFVLELNIGYVSVIPAVVFQQVTTGLFEELWFRGLLMTAMLIKWSGTVKGRIITILISSVLFALAHIDSFISSGNIWTLLGPLFLGIGFSAIYVYSKNLLSCMIIHAAYDIAQHLSSGLISSAHNVYYLISNIATNALICAIIPIFAIFLCIKASPFDIYCDGLENKH